MPGNYGMKKTAGNNNKNPAQVCANCKTPQQCRSQGRCRVSGQRLA